MAVTQATNNNKAIKFRNEFIRELVRGNMFSPYMGASPQALIRTMSYTDKTGGDQINIPFGKSLRAAGVSTGLLSGQEEQIENSGFRVWIDWSRNAVKISKAELKKMSVDIFDYAGPMLRDWAKVQQRDEIVQGLLAIPSTAAPLNLGIASGQRVNGTLWQNATNAQRSAWADMNADRIVFGQLNGNYVAGNFAASAANLTATNSRASAAILRLLKKKSETASPQVTPLQMDDGYDRVVVFCGPNAFRDFAADPLIYAANKDARPREGTSFNNNPIFNDSDLLYQGAIIRKVPQIDKYLQFTNSNGVQIAPIFMVGQSGLVMPWGQLPKDTNLSDDDYQFYDGKGVEMAYGIGKTMFTEQVSSIPQWSGVRYVDWGCATGFVASPDDA